MTEHIFSDNAANQGNTPEPFRLFLQKLNIALKRIFREDESAHWVSEQRGIPPEVLEVIMACNPLSVSIPAEYGGRGISMAENLAVLSEVAYESLALSLTFGINNALFLQPVAKYAAEEVKSPIFKRFLDNRNMGGLMITEPDFGSDALNMKTLFREEEQAYHIIGEKHWAGLTGMADYWLLTARSQHPGGPLQRDIGFFICDNTLEGQKIEVEEYFDNLGLYMIPYGRNRIDVRVPKVHRLVPETTGVMMMLDLLHRSRMHFPGMALGFIERILDEALDHCRQRQVGGRSLLNYDQVQERLSRLQASYTICSAMCLAAGRLGGLENNLTSQGMAANSMKSVVADLMQEAAQSLLQLVGAKAYKLSHIAGRGIVDSRPFQIFEGSNDILYHQLSENLIKQMKRFQESNLVQFLDLNEATRRSAEFFRQLLNFNISYDLPQRKLVELGRIISRVLSLEMIFDLEEQGFNRNLIRGAQNMLILDIQQFGNRISAANETTVVEDYKSGGSWFKS